MAVREVHRGSATRQSARADGDCWPYRSDLGQDPMRRSGGVGGTSRTLSAAEWAESSQASRDLREQGWSLIRVVPVQLSPVDEATLRLTFRRERQKQQAS